MCQYCGYTAHDGWTTLLEYDDVYREAAGASEASNYGFHESWDELRGQVAPGSGPAADAGAAEVDTADADAGGG